MDNNKKQECPKCKRMVEMLHDFGDGKMCTLCYWVRPCEKPPDKIIAVEISKITKGL